MAAGTVPESRLQVKKAIFMISRAINEKCFYSLRKHNNSKLTCNIHTLYQTKFRELQVEINRHYHGGRLQHTFHY